MILKIISFGNNDEYINLAEITFQSINNLYSNSETKFFKPEDLPDEIIKKLFLKAIKEISNRFDKKFLNKIIKS